MTPPPLPQRHGGESCNDFRSRVERVLSRHLEHCYACNYNTDDCKACDADEPSDDPDLHACNCRDIDPPGYGIRLRKLYEAALRDAAREAAGQ